jgi:hypothetical protein
VVLSDRVIVPSRFPAVLSVGSLKSFSQRIASEVMAMKARLLATAITTGHVAADFIRMVHANQNPSAADKPPQAPAAHAVLELFDDQDRSLPVDPVVPIKRLVRVLTEGLRGMPNLVGDDDGTISGARLFKGCKVRLRGIPERQFIIHDIYWDYQEVRVRQLGSSSVEYVLPWYCLRLSEE